MAGSIVAAASASGVANPLVCNKPTGTASGDVMVAFQSTDWGTAAAMTASGWTQLDVEDRGADNIHMKVWIKTAGGSEPATYDFAQGGAADGTVTIVTLRGVTADGALHDMVWDSNASTSRVAPTLTGANTGAVMLAAAMIEGGGGGATWTAPSGMVEQGDVQSQGTWTSQGVASLLNPGTPTGTKSFTCSVVPQGGVGGIQASVVLLAPTSASTPTVSAGTDVTGHEVNTAFVRTATENDNGATITAREWEILTGPGGAVPDLDLDAALSWTPTAVGDYTLRYSATNSVGTGADNVAVNVVAGSEASGYPTVRQFKSGANATFTSTTTTITLDSAAVAGNLLTYVMAGDKDTGTLTVADNTTDPDNWVVEVSAPMAAVSLYIAYKIADGGETTITATHTTSTPGGCTAVVAELEQTGTAPWGMLGKAQNIAVNLTGTTTRSTGTTAAVGYNGLGVAAMAVDTASNAATGSWSGAYNGNNLYDAPSTSGNAGGAGGIHVATGNVDATTTTTTTWTNSGGGADEQSAAVVVFGRQGTADTEINGTATAALGGLTATATGIRSTSGTAAAPLGVLTATATAVRDTAGTATAALGALTATATAIRSTEATATAVLGELAATAVGAHVYDGTATAPLGGLTATTTADVDHPATAAAALGELTATATAIRDTAATATAPLGDLTAAATGTVAGPNSGIADAPLGGLVATASAVRAIEGTAAAPLGGLAAAASAVVSEAPRAAALLGGLTAAAVADRTVPGTATATLGALAATATAFQGHPATASAPLGALVAAAVQEQPADGPEPGRFFLAY